MKFSLFMMPCHHPTENPTLAFQRDIGLVHYADELGFDEAFIGEHHSGGWETHPAPEMSLAMAAAKAQRIRLGTSVFSAPFHHPFQFLTGVFLCLFHQSSSLLRLLSPFSFSSD